ncbi:transposase [Breznakia sp. PF5-3]|uniref:transposase n=1 Tax=unclassified Breznakia TaxID=2623764 RepID=UPI00240697F5|nr:MULTISPECIES: transposase [unclassified Breznakia]MDF9825919.1 transposase [Breznakia sp. PM6-1]MDF9836715.1 transposase [Breznakia sp. PF5-3]MDF9839003.1 transposase [Breznakia sp. PFB2-8]MDF9861015.1 transposase [Breznakia sp. PH5-24]
MRKQYDKKFKLKVCKDIESEVTTVSNVAKEYSISRPIVSRWLSEYRRYQNKAFSGQGNRLPDKADIYALQKQVEELKKETEILKKFEHFVKQKK